VFKQIYYGGRDRLFLRMISLITVVGVNLFFLPFTLGANPNLGALITALAFSGLALSFAAIVNPVISFMNIYDTFSAPKGYPGMLAPVAPQKVLLGKILPAAIMDVAIVGLAIACTTSISFRLAGITGLVGEYIAPQYMALAVLGALGGYTTLLCAFAFGMALAKGAFFGSRLRGLTAFFTTLAVMWALHWMNAILLPFGSMHSIWLLFNLHIHPGSVGAVLYVLLFYVQAAILFLAATRLMERKINL